MYDFESDFGPLLSFVGLLGAAGRACQDSFPAVNVRRRRLGAGTGRNSNLLLPDSCQKICKHPTATLGKLCVEMCAELCKSKRFVAGKKANRKRKNWKTGKEWKKGRTERKNWQPGEIQNVEGLAGGGMLGKLHVNSRRPTTPSPFERVLYFLRKEHKGRAHKRPLSPHTRAGGAIMMPQRTDNRKWAGEQADRAGIR